MQGVNKLKTIMVAYDPKFLSKEEIAEINGDKSDIELVEHDL